MHENDKLTREVNRKGETVWELRPEDLPEPYQFINTQSCTRLANGNTIICSRGGSNKGPQLVEVAPAKKVAWVLQDWSVLGPATAVQVLDDPGIPEKARPIGALIVTPPQGIESFEDLGEIAHLGRMPNFKYLIIGGGMTADSAVQGIREIDSGGKIGPHQHGI